VHVLIWAVLAAHRLIAIVTLRVVLRSVTLGLVEAFKDQIRKFTLHEIGVDVPQDTCWLRLHNADVMHAAWWNSDNFFVHQRLDELRHLLNLFDTVVVGTVERRRWHQWCYHGNVVLCAARAVPRWSLVRVARLVAATRIKILFERIWDSRKSNIFKWASSPFFNIVNKLTELAAAIRAKTIQVAWVSETLGMCFAAGNCYYFLVQKCLDFCRIGLIWLVLIIFR